MPSKQVVITKNVTKIKTRTRKKTPEQSTYKCPVCGTKIKK